MGEMKLNQNSARILMSKCQHAAPSAHSGSGTVSRWHGSVHLKVGQLSKSCFIPVMRTQNWRPYLWHQYYLLISLCKEKARHSSCMCSSHYVAEIKTLFLHECDWNHFRDFNLAKLIIASKCYDSLFLGGCIARNACMCSRTGLSVSRDLKIRLKLLELIECSDLREKITSLENTFLLISLWFEPLLASYFTEKDAMRIIFMDNIRAWSSVRDQAADAIHFYKLPKFLTCVLPDSEAVLKSATDTRQYFGWDFSPDAQTYASLYVSMRTEQLLLTCEYHLIYCITY